MFYRLGLLAAVLGLSAPMTRLQSEVISSTVRLPKEPKHLRGNVYPHSSERQRARGRRQIASGFCKIANGLVRPGQVLVNADGQMFICRPYC